jgi:histidine triad (HIT) family protein
MPCLFCEILAGRIPATFIYRDKNVAAFMDIQPVNPGHVLVIPTSHAKGLDDLPAAAGVAVFGVAHRIARAMKKSRLKCEGVNLFLADGEAAMQEVFHLHLHLHVFPRFQGDGFGLKFSDGYSHKPERADLESAAEALVDALEVSPPSG